MFRTLDFGLAERQVRSVEGHAPVGPPAPGWVRWIDVHEPSPSELALLRERFSFHPLAIEDCTHQDQRPKAQEYDGYLFIVAQSFSCSDADVARLDLQELHAFLGKDYVITVRSRPMTAVERVRQRLERDPGLLKGGADFIYYLLVDELIDDNFPILDRVSDEIEAIEDQVLARPRRESVERIFVLRRNLVAMRRVLSPQREVISQLGKRGSGHVSDRTVLYLRDVHDQLSRIVESIESHRDLLGNALEVYLSAIGQRTNDIMKALAILSAVFMPLSFVTGFFGQNFDAIPVHSQLAFRVMLGSLIASPVVLLLWFKGRHWF